MEVCDLILDSIKISYKYMCILLINICSYDSTWLRKNIQVKIINNVSYYYINITESNTLPEKSTFNKVVKFRINRNKTCKFLPFL